jgi:hypothetical protein
MPLLIASVGGIGLAIVGTQAGPQRPVALAQSQPTSIQVRITDAGFIPPQVQIS